MLFDEGDTAVAPTGIDVAPRGAGAALETSETKRRHAVGAAAPRGVAARGGAQLVSPSTYEINAFAAAIRSHAPLNCGPDKAAQSAAWTIAANEAMTSGQ